MQVEKMKKLITSRETRSVISDMHASRIYNDDVRNAATVRVTKSVSVLTAGDNSFFVLYW
jgi:hypothetical protein